MASLHYISTSPMTVSEGVSEEQHTKEKAESQYLGKFVSPSKVTVNSVTTVSKKTFNSSRHMLDPNLLKLDFEGQAKEKSEIDQSKWNASEITFEMPLNLIEPLNYVTEFFGMFSVEKDKLFQSALAGNMSAKEELENFLENTPVLHKTMIDLFFKAVGLVSASSVSESQYQMGLAFLRGYCCPLCLEARKNFGLTSQANDREAVGWLKLAVQQGHIGAHLALSRCHNNGLGGLPKDNPKASQLYREALKKAQVNKDGEGLYLIGKQYFYGEDVAKNEDEAFAFLTASFATGSKQACYLLASCYFEGKSCLQSDKKGFEVLSKVSEDDRVGNFHLAKCYEHGKGCKKDLAEAYRCYERSNSPDDMERVSKKLTKSKCVIS